MILEEFVKMSKNLPFAQLFVLENGSYRPLWMGRRIDKLYDDVKSLYGEDYVTQLHSCEILGFEGNGQDQLYIVTDMSAPKNFFAYTKEYWDKMHEEASGNTKKTKSKFVEFMTKDLF